MSEQVAIRISKTALAWLLLNSVGVAIYIAVASATWIEPELASIPGASGGAAFVWFFTAAPVLLLFALGHLVAGIWAITRRIRSGAWPFQPVALASVALWAAAVALDSLRHGA